MLAFLTLHGTTVIVSPSCICGLLSGCKIKALRSKTNTYIKTPVRGEEPVFVITGRREDVEIAKTEILQAAEHFTQIRAQRRLHPPPHIPGQVSSFV